MGEALKKWAEGWRLRGWVENKNLVAPTATADETLGNIFLLLRFLSGRP